MVIGVPYDFEYEFSEIFLKDSSTTPSAILSGRLQLRTFTVVHSLSAGFHIAVESIGRDPYVYDFGGALGTSGMTLGSLSLQSGKFRVPVMSRSNQTTITLHNTSPYPSSFQSAEWEGTFNMLSQRM